MSHVFYVFPVIPFRPQKTKSDIIAFFRLEKNSRRMIGVKPYVSFGFSVNNLVFSNALNPHGCDEIQHLRPAGMLAQWNSSPGQYNVVVPCC